MLTERAISEEWLWRAIMDPEQVLEINEDQTHYLKTIPENGSRVLRVVVNPLVTPARVVTLFFDRSLRKK